MDAVDSIQLEAARARAASKPVAQPSIAMCAESREKRKLEDTVDSDAFLDDWDMTIRRCPACDRPFGTLEKLAKHQETWTNGSCSAAAPRYEKPSPGQDDTGIEDLIPGADLIVNLDDGESESRFRVPSQVLAAASSCFQVSFGPTAQFEAANDVRRAAIHGSFSAEIHLDDNPAAMKLVLQILCFRYTELPATVDFRTIVEIAIIADKYELDMVLRPWATKWSKPYEKVLRLPEEDDEEWSFDREEWSLDDSIMDHDGKYDDWLFISWVFGHEKAFVAISRVLTMMDNDFSQLCKQTPETVLGMFVVFKWIRLLIPLTFGPEKIRQLRSSRVQKLREAFDSIRAARGREHSQSLCRYMVQNKACDAMQLGYLCELIIKLKLDTEVTWAGNFAGLTSKIKEIEHEDALNHKLCGWIDEFRRVAREAIEEDLHLNLLDFPSRIERMMLRSPLDSVENRR